MPPVQVVGAFSLWRLEDINGEVFFAPDDSNDVLAAEAPSDPALTRCPEAPAEFVSRQGWSVQARLPVNMGEAIHVKEARAGVWAGRNSIPPRPVTIIVKMVFEANLLYF